MINFFKSIIPNLFFWPGYFVMYLGMFLHKVFNTNLGKRLKWTDKVQKIFEEELVKSFDQQRKNKYYTSSVESKENN